MSEFSFSLNSHSRFHEVRYLGYIIGDTGVRPNPDKIKAIQNIPALRPTRRGCEFENVVNLKVLYKVSIWLESRMFAEVGPCVGVSRFSDR